MKLRLLLFTAILLFYACGAFSQAGMWTWIKGSVTTNPTPNFGTQGVEVSTNEPPGFYEAAEWTDTDGNFWLFGGVDDSANAWGDLWRFNPVTNNWTWMKGTGAFGTLGVYGIQGVPSVYNLPPARAWGVPTWVDNHIDLWLYGGQNEVGNYSDMWRYNIASNMWTWMQGPSYPGAWPSYGTLGIESTSNSPGVRDESDATWVDSAGNLWLYGGDQWGAYNSLGKYGDLWMYNTSTNNWTWMAGSDTLNVLPVYGTKGVPAASNTPGSRWTYCTWTDANGNFWLFGGLNSNDNALNDMWRYEPATGNWTWMAGTDIVGSNGNYGTQCNSDTGLVPSVRYETRARWKDDCGNFWFYGGTDGVFALYNDLWYFNPVSLKWTFVNGISVAAGFPNYGTFRIASATNTPGGRMGAIPWRNKSGELYLFGGSVWDFLSPYNDVWKFTIDPSCGDIGTPPTINLGFDTTYCSTFSRVLSANNANTIWSTGDTAAQITITQPGVYWATLYFSCGTSTDTIRIAQDEVTILTDSISTSCGLNNGSVSVTAISGNSPFAYQWNSGSSSDTLINLSPGTYGVTAIDSMGCIASASGMVDSSTNNVALQIDSVNTSCGQNNGSVLVTPISGNAPFIYQWNNGASSDTLNNLSAGVYTVTTADSTGCTASASAIIDSSVNSVVLQTDSINTTCGKTNGSASVTVTSGNAPFIFQWNTGSSTDTLSNLSAGVYAVTLTDSTGCTASANVVVDSSSAPGNINITATDTSFCSGDSTTICAPAGFSSYLWNTGPTTQCITTTQAGNYYVTVTNSSGCADTSSPLAINVLSAPPVTITINGDTLSAYNAVTYQWYFNNAPLQGDTDSVLVATLPGTYSVAVSDSNGCVIMSNNQTVAGINNLQDEMALKVYPDPATDELNILYQLNSPATLQISITDITSRRITNVLNEKELSGNYLQHVNIHELASGVYILNFISESGSVNLRFVKE